MLKVQWQFPKVGPWVAIGGSHLDRRHSLSPLLTITDLTFRTVGVNEATTMHSGVTHAIFAGHEVNSKAERTVCPRRLDPFFKVTYYIKWVKTSCTFCSCLSIYMSSNVILVVVTCLNVHCLLLYVLS